MNKKKTIAIIAILLIIAILIGGIFAYFKDTDEVTNVFTIGNIDITLHENDAWVVASGSNVATNDSAVNLTPGAVIEKTPYVSNDSTSGNPAYIFVKVTVPVGDVDGDANTPDEQLFSYTVQEGWTATPVATTTIAASTGSLAKNVYVYAYATNGTMTSVPAGAAGAAEDATNATTSVFDTVKLNENITSEGLAVIQNEHDIKVEAYGIQANNLADGLDTPAEIWNLFNVNPTAATN